MNPCYLCGKPGSWPLSTLKYVLGSGLPLCGSHKAKLELDLKDYKEKTEEPVLKTMTKPFIPPIPKEPIKNFQDREPNDGSLME